MAGLGDPATDLACLLSVCGERFAGRCPLRCVFVADKGDYYALPGGLPQEERGPGLEVSRRGGAQRETTMAEITLLDGEWGKSL